MTVFLKRQIARSLWNIRNRLLMVDWPSGMKPPVVTHEIYFHKLNDIFRVKSGNFTFIKYMDTEVEICNDKTFTLGKDLYNSISFKNTKPVYLCYVDKYVIPIEKNQDILYPLVKETFKEIKEFIEAKEKNAR